MTNVLDILPLIGGWEWVRINSVKPLDPNDAEVLFESDSNDKGWILGGVITTDNDQCGVLMTYNTAETGQTINFKLLPKTLNDANKVSANNTSPYVSVYDDLNDRYEVVYAPNPPFPFNGTLTIEAVGGPSGGTVTTDINLIRITDVDTFINGLRQVLGITSIIDLLSHLQVPPTPGPIPLPRPRPTYEGFLP